MGKAIIKENRGGGSYLIELVIARDRVDAEILGLDNKLTELNAKYPSGDEEKDKELKIAITACQKRLAYLNEHVPENVQMSANCVDFVDDLAVDSVVGTIEIARSQTQVWKIGEDKPYQYTSGIWIRPGYSDQAVYNAVRDGILNPPINQNPWQLYWNWAMMPPSQKWKPRYRRAIINNLSGDYADITLTDLVYLTEDLAEIDIDQTLSLISVPIVYMDCNGQAFKEGDAVIVEFTGQDWDSAKVVGFYGPPQECVETQYYAVIFQKYNNGFIPIQTSQVYEKQYLKIKIDGSIEWTTQAEALAQCHDDCYRATKQRPFIGIFYWSEGFDHKPYITCPSTVLNADGPEVPENYGVFNCIYSTQHGLAKPKSDLSIYEIDGIEFNIWDSYLAVCVENAAGSTLIHKNNVRKVETQAWKDEHNGYYLCKQYETWYNAIPREIGVVTDDLCTESGWFVKGYQPQVSNGGYIAADDRVPWGEYYDYGSIRYGRNTGLRSTFWWDVSVYKEVFTDETVHSSISKYKWDGPHPGGIDGSRWLYYTIGRRDGTIANDDMDAYVRGTNYLVSSIPSPPRNAGSTCLVFSSEPGIEGKFNVYVCPCKDGPLIIPYPFKNPAAETGELPHEVIRYAMMGTLPTCEWKWTRETHESYGEVSQKNIAQFPSAGEHYSEGADIEPYVTYEYEFCGKYSETIDSIFYAFNEDQPTWLYLYVNFTQTSDDGNDLDDKCLSMIVERGTGIVIHYDVLNTFVESGVQVALDSAENVFPEMMDYAEYTSMLSAKRMELGASSYYVARMTKKTAS